MSVMASEAPAFHLDLLDSAFNRDPYPTLEEIRATGPVVYNELIPDGWMCTGYRTCARILANVRKFRQPPELYTNIFGDLVFEAIDTPRHDEIRGVWAYEFQRDTLRESRRGMVERVVDRALDPFVERVSAGEAVDASAELHRTIPVFVILEMLGLDPADQEQVSAWATEMPKMIEGMAERSPRGAQLMKEAAAGTASLNEYLGAIIEPRRQNPGSDLVSRMVTSDVAKTMSFGELVANNTQLVFAGSETTSRLMSRCLFLLARDPGQRRAVAEDRSLIPQAIEEVHRFETVTQVAAPRYVVAGDADIAGVRVPEGKRVVLLLGAANRDPDRWEWPDRFDIFRERKQQIGFGFGMHSCLGLNLARMEIEIYLNRLFDRLPDWELAGDADLGMRFFGHGSHLPVVRG